MSQPARRLWPRRTAPAEPAPGAALLPLEGTSLLWTRPGAGSSAAEGSSGDLAPEALAALGAEVLEAPAIEFASFVERNLEQCRLMLDLLRRHEGWLILPSPTAVRYFGEMLGRFHLDLAVFDDIYLATIGRGSTAELQRLGLSPDFTPPGARGAALAQTLPTAPGTPVVIAGSSQTRPELREGLAGRGLSVQVLPLYAPRACRPGLRAIGAALAERPGRLIVVTSPSGAEAIVRTLQREPPLLDQAHWVAIGPTTHQALLAHGVAPQRCAEAATPTLEGLLPAIAALATAQRGAPEAPR